VETEKKYFYLPSLSFTRSASKKLKGPSLSVSHDFSSVGCISFGFWYSVAKETHIISLSLSFIWLNRAKVSLTLDRLQQRRRQILPSSRSTRTEYLK
jgi:hypothetical protein